MKTTPPLFKSTDEVFADLVHSIHGEGTWEQNHTGVDALTVFGISYRLNVRDYAFPILTTKETKWKASVKELIWYLSGEKGIQEFRNHSKIWDQWADEEGKLESAYGRYWRNYPIPAHYVGRDHHSPKHLVDGEAFPTTQHPAIKYKDGLFVFDQLRHIINLLKSETRSRRMVMYAWYPPNAAVSKLPPCHHTVTFVSQIKDGKRILNLHLNQRSLDIGLGFSFNQFAYCLLLLMICRETAYKPGQFWHSASDAHIYRDHLDPLLDCINREHHPLPKIIFPEKSLFNLNFNDAANFKLEGYVHKPFVKLTCHE